MSRCRLSSSSKGRTATCLSGATSLGPRAAACDGCSTIEAFPSPFIVLFLYFVFFVNLYNCFINFICNKG